MQVIKHFTDEYKQVFASVSIDAENQFLMCSWREPNTSPELFPLLHYCEQAFKALDLKYVLSDITVCQPKAQARVQKEMLAGFTKTGFCKVAFVNRALNCPALDQQENVDVMYFQQLPLAIEWFFLPKLEDEAWEDLDVMEF